MAKPFVTVEKDGRYSPSLGIELGAAGYRLTFDIQLQHQPEYLRECLGSGLETYLTGDTNSYPDVNWAAVRENPEDRRLWEPQVTRTIAQYSKLYRDFDTHTSRHRELCTYINVWNEWNDTGYEGSRMPASVVNRGTEIWRFYFPDHKRIVAASDISGSPDSIAELDLTHVNSLDIHLWNKGPNNWPDYMSGRLLDTLNKYQRRWPGRKFCISEIGFSSTEGSDEDTQALYCGQAMTELVQRADLEMVGWYAMQDWRGMGLLRADMSKKLSFWHYRLGSQYWDGERVVVEPLPQYVYAYGFARLNELNPGLFGEPLENEQMIVPGFITQRTSEGDLVFAAVKNQGDIFTFTKRDNGDRYRWTVDDLGL